MTLSTPEHEALVELYHAVSDYLLGLHIREFAVENGGTDVLLGVMQEKYNFYTEHYNTVENEDNNNG